MTNDLERAVSILQALPTMSETIVDDTLYEKVYSFLTQTFQPSLSNEIVQSLETSLKSRDERIRSVAVRLIGPWLRLAEPIPASFRAGIHDALHSSHATLRVAAVETMCFRPDAFREDVGHLLMDQSHYVVRVTCVWCRLVREDVSEVVKMMLRSEDKRGSGLEFLWVYVDSEDQESLDYLREKKLLHDWMDWISNQRMIEILGRLFEWDDDPLRTLGLGSGESFKVMAKIGMKLELIGLSILEVSWKLCKPTQVPVEVIQYLFKTWKETKKPKVMQRVIRNLRCILPLEPSLTQEKEFNAIFDKLRCFENHQTLSCLLGLLTDTLQWNKKIVDRSIQTLVDLLMDDYTSLDCKSLLSVYDTLNRLLEDQTISFGKPFVDALSLRFLDKEWDVRDATIQFVGELFNSNRKIKFAIEHDLPLQVFYRVQDSEPYVRASAIEVLEKMMKSKEGWDYIQHHKVSRDLASQLPRLLYDTEAFVRRATLDAISCLVFYRSCQGMNMELFDTTKENPSLNPEILRKLINDEDTDVRIRACTLIDHFWNLYQHEKYQNKKHQENHIDFFQSIRPGFLLTEAVNDTSRVVRAEAVRVIDHILSSQPKQEIDLKRKIETVDIENEFETELLKELNQINLEQKKQTLDPEHLYQEAFDIDAYVMTQSIVPKDSEDDVNMLDCY